MYHRGLYIAGVIFSIVGIVLMVVASERLKNNALSQDDKTNYNRWYDSGVGMLVVGIVLGVAGAVVQYMKMKKVKTPSPGKR